jgi:hypothetical protein
MSRVLPTGLLPITGLLALVLAWPRPRLFGSGAVIVGQVVAITVACIRLVWLGWITLWW